ncbi:PadR family transcriptional regulator [Asanoa iriomotensis]|uniref:PadR family transcriptional regulator n=1 Tax=Asanoa iriomotensis TaxID=234613 RepID=UPI00194499B1|nr:PadR family transcriptional regulator [Asanoa iriomotensis]
MDQDRRAQWLRGVLDLCVLGLLARGDSYGYELAQSLQSAGLGVIQGGTLYPVLLRLQRSGLVTVYWREGGGGPARKYYQVSPAGRTVLAEASGQWSAFAGGVGAILQERTAP